MCSFHGTRTDDYLTTKERRVPAYQSPQMTSLRFFGYNVDTSERAEVTELLGGVACALLGPPMRSK